jgi:hypothetical protein
MADLNELLERVEKAMGPDRELDGEIAAALRDGDKLPDWAKNWAGEWRPTIQGSVVLMQNSGEPGPHFSSSKYTASIDAALALVERKLPGWHWSVSNPFISPPTYHACVANPEDNGAIEPWNIEHETHEGAGANGPLAILVALLAALIGKGRK